MKYIVLIMALFCALSYSKTTQACDICGCGVGGYYSGMLPQFHKNFIGLRWRYSQFRSDIGHELEGIDALSTELFHTLELTARYYPHRRVQLLAFIPLNLNTRLAPNGNYQLAGLGDVSLLALYNVYNTSFIAEKTIKHNWLIGGGIKAPTGFNQWRDEQDELLTPSLQLGTGSLDFILASMYTLRYKRWGVNTNISYKINLANSDAYRFGNQLAANLTAFWLHKIKKTDWGLMPTLGVAFEQANFNTKKGYKRINTGGQQLLVNIGLEAYYKRFQFRVNYQQPTWQNLSDGLVIAERRVLAGVNYLF